MNKSILKNIIGFLGWTILMFAASWIMSDAIVRITINLIGN